MRKSFCVPALLAIFVYALPAKAQDETPKAGYDYGRVNSGGTSFNFNGGSGQLVYNVNNWLVVVGDLGGYYTSNGFGGGIFSYLFGPRINLRGRGEVTPFAQALFGGVRSLASSP